MLEAQATPSDGRAPGIASRCTLYKALPVVKELLSIYRIPHAGFTNIPQSQLKNQHHKLWLFSIDVKNSEINQSVNQTAAIVNNLAVWAINFNRETSPVLSGHVKILFHRAKAAAS